MEKKEIAGRIRHLECLLKRAKEDGQLGMVVYYQVLLDELVIAFNELNIVITLA